MKRQVQNAPAHDLHGEDTHPLWARLASGRVHVARDDLDEQHEEDFGLGVEAVRELFQDEEDDASGAQGEREERGSL